MAIGGDRKRDICGFHLNESKEILLTEMRAAGTHLIFCLNGINNLNVEVNGKKDDETRLNKQDKFLHFDLY